MCSIQLSTEIWLCTPSAYPVHSRVDIFTDTAMSRICGKIKTPKNGKFRTWQLRACGQVALDDVPVLPGGLFHDAEDRVHVRDLPATGLRVLHGHQHLLSD